MSNLHERHFLEILILPLALVVCWAAWKYGLAGDIFWETGELILLGTTCWWCLARAVRSVHGRRSSALRGLLALLRRAVHLSAWKACSMFDGSLDRTLAEFVYAMCAKVTLADGVTSWNEATTFNELMQERFSLTNEQQVQAMDAFHKAKHSPHSLEDYARAFKEFAGGNRAMCDSVMHLLIPVVYADGKPSEKVISELDAIRRILGIDRRDYDAMIESISK